MPSRPESALESRVARLERALRVQRTLTVLSLLALAAVVTLGATGGTPEVIRAERFEVVNERGQPLVLLKRTSYGGQVQTLGNDGVSGVALGAGSSGGYVGVRDSKPSLFPRVELSTDSMGGMLAVRSWLGFAVEVDHEGLSVAHTQEEGNLTRVDPRVVLGVSEHGGHLRIMNATGEPAAVVRAEEGGAGLVQAYGPDGEPR